MGRTHHRRRLPGDTRRQANYLAKHSNSNQQKINYYSFYSIRYELIQENN